MFSDSNNFYFENGVAYHNRDNPTTYLDVCINGTPLCLTINQPELLIVTTHHLPIKLNNSLYDESYDEYNINDKLFKERKNTNKFSKKNKHNQVSNQTHKYKQDARIRDKILRNSFYDKKISDEINHYDVIYNTYQIQFCKDEITVPRENHGYIYDFNNYDTITKIKQSKIKHYYRIFKTKNSKNSKNELYYEIIKTPCFYCDTYNCNLAAFIVNGEIVYDDNYPTCYEFREYIDETIYYCEQEEERYYEELAYIRGM
jgi:hypothetical protein